MEQLFHLPDGSLLNFSKFQDRLKFLLNGRKIYPWAQSLGVSRGAAEKIYVKGVIPGPEILRAIYYKEGVDLSWFITGEGAPFRVYSAVDKSDFYCRISEMLERYKGSIYELFFLYNQEFLFIAASSIQHYTYKEKELSYKAWELLSGPNWWDIVSLLAMEFPHNEIGYKVNWYHCRTHSKRFGSIRRGEFSPSMLFGDGPHSVGWFDLERISQFEDLESGLRRGLDYSSWQQENHYISSSMFNEIAMEVNFFCDKQELSLGEAARVKLYIAVYNHCMRTGERPRAAVSHTLPNLLDVVDQVFKVES
ncbi:hypothetical protein [Endozoicomonas ascidiicola]|uniref:hypothetical protein n=1 Tax=Endozoicomonas ascidiicola TaxID=1698521 RepID=UPI0012FCB4C1|nr:hypothetical protein [Endozoicomonas ascidiicola]